MVMAQLSPGHARDESHSLMTDQQGERGVHALSGSMSQEGQHLEISNTNTMVDVAQLKPGHAREGVHSIMTGQQGVVGVHAPSGLLS